MKTKILIIQSCLLVFLLGITGCQDFLNISSDSQKQTSNSFKTIADLRAATAYLYTSPWYQFNNNGWQVIEGRANNLAGDGTSSILAAYASFAETGSTAGLYTTWQSLYNVVTQSDYVINDYAPITRQYVDSTSVNACEGEARFMRGTAYWYLAMLWHDVPIIDDPKDYTENSQVYANNFEDVIQYAINDLTYAEKWLPSTDASGRVTKFSAKGMLARLCLTAADYAMGGHFSTDYLTRNNKASNDELATYYLGLVKTLTNDVIVSGTQYGLVNDYEDLYKVQNNNNKESLFSLQFVPSSTITGLGSTLMTNLAYSTTLTGGLNAYGGSMYASYDIVHLSSLDSAMSRSRANFFQKGQTYSYLSALATTAYTNTKCNVKKYVVGNSTDTGGKAINGNSGLMTPMLRMADIYLMYTEACIGLGTQTTDALAVSRFNDVRYRAFYYNRANNYNNSYKAATVVTRDALFKARRLEFFMENLFWPDIVRRSFYDMTWVTNYLNNSLYGGYSYVFIGTSTSVKRPESYNVANLSTQLTNFVWHSYTYDPTNTTSSYSKGFVTSLTNTSYSPRVPATFSWSAAVHNVGADSYVHAADAQDNIWALPYPDSEVAADPLLNQKPVKFNF